MVLGENRGRQILYEIDWVRSVRVEEIWGEKLCGDGRVAQTHLLVG